ncbi:hypothetical protein [Streptomyces europaeiscabiei]|uniref:hypothetical protein n=1 Tax=Streptomyces europaeiscabiei TaxID=146819 RepID=UPI002E270DA3|nr:hypothetical protein OG858_05345 [Streptomyces europaeiscabiei]
MAAVVRRTLLYGGLTALVLCLYAGVTAAVPAAVPTSPCPPSPPPRSWPRCSPLPVTVSNGSSTGR